MKALTILGIISASIQLLIAAIAVFVGSKLGAAAEFMGADTGGGALQMLKMAIVLILPAISLVALSLFSKNRVLYGGLMIGAAVVFAILVPTIFIFVSSGIIIFAGGLGIYEHRNEAPAAE